LECNPKNISAPVLEIWKGLGINRLSIGVQTLHGKGLQLLTRDHDASAALRALELSSHVIPNVNMDLIYGWPGQTQDDWKSDLTQLVASGVPHASLYSLTFEERTPFGRMAKRGRMFPEPDETFARAYEVAREVLGKAGFEHDEVSNWARPGFTCRHNWLYWDFKPFMGIGAGAHGFLPIGRSDEGEIDIGIRYAFSRDVRTYLRRIHDRNVDGVSSRVEMLQSLGAEVDGRDKESALIEYVGGTLRTRHGVDLAIAEKIAGREFVPRPAIAQALKQKIAWRDGTRLRFDPSEWFRENSWASELLLSF
jgi:oxygen-independent coproporphyrinogen-3 oxidase